MAQVNSVGQAPTTRLADSLWEKAVEALDEEYKLDIDFERESKLAILEDILKAVDEKKQACLKGRWKYKKDNKEIIIRDQLEKVAEWVNKFKEVGNSAIQYDPVHAALPWAGIRFFLQITVNDIQIFGAMVEGMELVSNLVTRYVILEKLYLDTINRKNSAARNQLVKAILELYTSVLKYLSKARRYYDRKTSKRVVLSAIQNAELSVDVYIRKILDKQANVDTCLRLMDAELYNNLNDRMQDAHGGVHNVQIGVRDVQRGVQEVQSLLGSLAINDQHLNEEVQRLKAVLSQLDEPIVRSATQLLDLHDRLKRNRLFIHHVILQTAAQILCLENERKELIRWISTIPCRDHHKAMGKDFMPKSGLWLLRNAKFIEWRKSSAKSILWLHGIPGSGKSKLIYCVIECLNRHISSNIASVPMAYFYCTRNTAEPERANPDEIMRSILKQLSCTNLQQPIREPVAGTYKQRKKEADNDGCEPTKLTLQECVELILALLEANPATIVIDALDECDPARRHELLLALDRIREESASLVKIFISSRDDQDIVCRLNNSPDVFIHATDNCEDIENFIRLQINQSIKDKTLLCGNVSEVLKSRIISTLIEGSQGMFRWVSLQIQNLCDSQRMKHEKDIDAELGQLRKTLWESYDIIYKQIQNAAPTSRQVSENAMKWLLCARRPLSPSEFIAALSIDSEGQFISLEVSEVLHMCCNMVILDEKFEVFRFAHLSVREYLESREEYTEIETHTLAAERCIDTYILGPSSELSSKQNRKLSQYATLYWPIHCQCIGSHQWGDRLLRKIKRFLFKDYTVAPSFIGWESAISNLYSSLGWNSPLRSDLNEFSGLPPNPLFLACRFGWLSIISENICTFESLGWNQRNDRGNTGIILAAKNDHEGVVKLLVENGADIESRNDKGQTPLSRAAENGHEGVVKFLVENDADIESKDKEGQTPLSWAAEKGHEGVTRLLVENGADMESKDIYGWTPLLSANFGMKRAVLKLLLKKGAKQM